MIRGELFNQDMVKAFLEDRKIKTSRPIPKKIIDAYYDYDDYCKAVMPTNISCTRDYEQSFFMSRAKHHIGDVIYARETFREVGWDDNGDAYDFKADGDDNELPWTPSIHMPRSAARLWFRVTDVKVQKTNDVTEQDAVEDGFKYRGWSPTFNDPDSGGDGECETPLDQFQEFWQKQYGDNQQWMWVYYLQPITKEEVKQNEQ